jgi:hypothetical protein
MTTPEELKTYFQDTIVANNNKIDHLISGNVERLQQHFKNETGTVLFIEWAGKRFNDDSGSIGSRFVTGVSLLKGVPNGDFDKQDEVLNELDPIVTQLLLRIRRDALDNGWNFSINDVSQIDPVFFYTVDNCFGYRFELVFGDWEGIELDPTMWRDVAE